MDECFNIPILLMIDRNSNVFICLIKSKIMTGKFVRSEMTFSRKTFGECEFVLFEMCETVYLPAFKTLCLFEGYIDNEMQLLLSSFNLFDCYGW